MEGLEPPENPPSSVTAADIRKRITETAQAGEATRQALGEMQSAGTQDRNNN
jgi:hypothetical protein